MALETAAGSFQALFDRMQRIEQLVTSPEAMPASGGDSEFESITLTPVGGGASIILNAIAPGVPTGLSATPGSFEETSFADLSWVGPVSPPAFSYQVEVARKDVASGVYQISEIRQTVGTTMRVEALDAGVTYGFRVAGINRTGVVGALSARVDFVAALDSTLPSAPTGLAVFRAPSSIVATWNQNTEADVKDGHGLYSLQLSTAANFGTILRENRISATVHSFSGLDSETTYYVRVAAIDASGNQSPWSAGVNAVAGGITGAMILADAVGSTQLASAAVTAAKIAGLAVDSTKIAANAVTTAKIALDAITEAQLADAAVTAAQLSPAAVTAAALANGAVTAPAIAASAVIAGKIAANAVTAAEIAANSIIAGKIAADAVTSGTIAAGAVTAGKIAALSITASEIAANTITAAKIAGDTITANEIAANAITATELSANAVTAGKIAANAITATNIAAGAVTTDKLTVASMGDNKILNGDFEGATYTSGADTFPEAWGGVGGTGGNVSIGVGVNGVGKSLRLTPANTTTGVYTYSKGTPVVTGETYFWSCRYRSIASNVGSGVYLTFNVMGAPALYAYEQVTQNTLAIDNVAATTGWTYAEGQIVATATGWAVWRPHAWLGTAGVAIEFDEIVLKKVENSTTIADGAITTAKIVTDAITSTKIVAGAVTSTHITVGTLNGDRITANTMDVAKLLADSVLAKNIVIGAGGQFTIGTSPGNVTNGQGIILNSQGLSLYKSDGVRTVFLDSATGSATFTGTLSGTTIIGTTSMASGSISGGTITGATVQTSASGSRIVLNSALQTQFSGSVAVQDFYSQFVSDFEPSKLYAVKVTDATFGDYHQFTISGGRLTNNINPPAIFLVSRTSTGAQSQAVVEGERVRLGRLASNYIDVGDTLIDHRVTGANAHVFGGAGFQILKMSWEAATSTADTRLNSLPSNTDSSNDYVRVNAATGRLYRGALSGGAGTLTIKDEGTIHGTSATAINFTGNGVAVTLFSGGEATVSIPGTGVKDEGTTLMNLAQFINFVGAGVTVTDTTGGTATVTIPGGGGSTNVFTSAIAEAEAGLTQVRIGVVSGSSPRIMFEHASAPSGSRVWEIDNDGGLLRFLVPGSVKMSLTTGGQVQVTHAVVTGNIYGNSLGGNYYQSADFTGPYMQNLSAGGNGGVAIVNRNNIGNSVFQIHGMAGQTGDLMQVYHNGSNLGARIDKDGWLHQPAYKGFSKGTGTQAFTSNVFTIVKLNVNVEASGITWNDHNATPTETNSSRFVVTKAGEYEITGRTHWHANSSGFRTTHIMLNDTVEIDDDHTVSLSSVGGGSPTQRTGENTINMPNSETFSNLVTFATAFPAGISPNIQLTTYQLNTAEPLLAVVYERSNTNFRYLLRTRNAGQLYNGDVTVMWVANGFLIDNPQSMTNYVSKRLTLAVGDTICIKALCALYDANGAITAGTLNMDLADSWLSIRRV